MSCYFPFKINFIVMIFFRLINHNRIKTSGCIHDISLATFMVVGNTYCVSEDLRCIQNQTA
jgi:hypothetical protein